MRISTYIIVCIFLIEGLVTFSILPRQKSQILGQNSKTSHKRVLAETDIKTPTNTPTPSPTLTPTPTPIPPTFTPTPTPSPTPTQPPQITTTSSLEDLFTKYSQDYNVDKELLKKIANCESSFNSNATNNDYAGMFQFSGGSWTTARNNMGQNNDPALRLNPEESIRTAAFLISQNQAGMWPTCSK